MTAPKRTQLGHLRRIRHMDYQIVRNVSFQSLSFFGSLAFLIGVAFNVGMFYSFGFKFISVLSPQDMLMTAFALLVFLVAFYTAVFVLMTKSILAYEIFTVARRRGIGRLGRSLALASGSVLVTVVLFVFFAHIFFTYHGASLPVRGLLVMSCFLLLLVFSAPFMMTRSRRRAVGLGAVHCGSLVAFGLVFGFVVARHRAEIPWTIVTTDGRSIRAGVVLVTSEGVFFRLPMADGGYTSHFIVRERVVQVDQ